MKNNTDPAAQRDFDHSLFLHHPSEDLRIDMERLQDLNEKTKEEYERAEV